MGCHGGKRHHRHRSDEDRERVLSREDPVDLKYARGELDREAYLAAKGRIKAAPTAVPGVASELEAARKELVNVRNRVSALREERGRLKARLAVLEGGAAGALRELGLDAHERFEEKRAIEGALKNTERALRSSERALLKLEALVASLEAEEALARVTGMEGESS